MANERRKREHAFRVSFEQNVGSSFDPNMEDVTEWESQLREVEEELAPPEDLFDEDEEYWAELYEEHARNEVPSPSEWQAAANEPNQTDNFPPQPILAQKQTPGNADSDFNMDIEA